jgi:hypothetical protein
MAFKFCSVADVTLTITATQNDPAQKSEAVWYGGSWMVGGVTVRTTRTLLFRVVYTGTSPGLYWWHWYHTEYFYQGWNDLEWTGTGNFVKGFDEGGSLTAVLRFVTSYDEDGHGSAEMFCDGVSLQTFAPSIYIDPVDLEDLISGLYFSLGGWDPVGESGLTMKVSPVVATVWEVGQAGTKVLVTDGAPTNIASARHDWRDWVDYIKDGGDEEEYEVADDLHAEGFWSYWAQLTVGFGEDLYGAEDESAYLGTIQVAFRKWFTGLPPVLGITHNAVADSLLVSDCALSATLDVGFWRVNRTSDGDGQWTERMAVPETAGARTANLVSTITGMVLVEEIGGQTKIVPNRSLTGDWGEPVTVGSGRTYPHGIETAQRYGLTALVGSDLSYNIQSKEMPYAAVHDKVTVDTSIYRTYSVVAKHPLTWRLYAAANTGSGIWLYSSSDSGLTWIHLGVEDGSVNGLGTGASAGNWDNEYPWLYCDREYLWLVTYRAGATAGAQGQCALYQFRHEPAATTPILFPGELALTLVQQGTVVAAPGGNVYGGVLIGPADAGRPALIRDPQTWQLTVIVPKTRAWDDTTLPTPGIVEYTSNDTGVTWKQKGSHAC